MPTLHLIGDHVTGEIGALGKNGRIYPLAEIEAAEEAAARGDPDAAATLAAVDHGVDEHGHPVSTETAQALREIMDDCPLCRAERERTGRDPDVLFSGTFDDPGDLALDAIEAWSREYARRARRKARGRK